MALLIKMIKFEDNRSKCLVVNLEAPIQTLNYAYNIRSWLTNINDVSALGEDMFALGLGYTSGDNPQYNAEKPSRSFGIDFIVFRASSKSYKNRRFFTFRDGNIAAMQWATKDFGANTYNFDYDGANRITEALFSGSGQHNTSYTYDKNGNIESLTREGRHGGSNLYGDIDNLTYTYQGNQLQSVNDISYGAYQADGFKDNGSFEPIEYTYDDNGNLLTDLNKSLSISKYNHLNLPEQLNLNPPQHYYEISYLYSATGQKLHKATHIDFTPATTTDYVGSFIYHDDQLQSILTQEGRVVVNGSSYEYQYFLKDHLGNTRVTFNSGGIIQEDSYYPYGMNMAGLSESSGIDLPNKFLYNGKELQDDFGLDWYDYGARFYDAVLGRWHVVDPMSEIARRWSSYQYAYNNPIRFIDPDGMMVDEYEFNSKGNIKNVKSSETDSFHKVDEKGNRIEGASLQLDKKVVTGELTLSTTGGKEVDFLKVEGDESATQIFKFLAENTTEAKTEIGLTRIGEASGEDGKNMIGVNVEHTESRTYANSAVFDNGYSIREANHSHPNDNMGSSIGDIATAKKIQNKFPKATFNNYTKTWGFTSYDRNTIPGSVFMLDGVEIK